MGSVLPGKYKFKLKSGDSYDASKPFAIKARMRKDNGKKIKKPTKVTVYAYPYDIKIKSTEVMTDKKGWITLYQSTTWDEIQIKSERLIPL